MWAAGLIVKPCRIAAPEPSVSVKVRVLPEDKTSIPQVLVRSSPVSVDANSMVSQLADSLKMKSPGSPCVPPVTTVVRLIVLFGGLDILTITL